MAKVKLTMGITFNMNEEMSENSNFEDAVQNGDIGFEELELKAIDVESGEEIKFTDEESSEVLQAIMNGFGIKEV
jgi:hypothetical protein